MHAVMSVVVESVMGVISCLNLGRIASVLDQIRQFVANARDALWAASLRRSVVLVLVSPLTLTFHSVRKSLNVMSKTYLITKCLVSTVLGEIL